MITIEERVMANVGVIHAGRTLLSRVAVELYALVASGFAIWQLTWVHKVFANFFMVEREGFGHTITYVVYAIEHTHLAVQLSLAVGAVAFVLLLADLVGRTRSHSLAFS